MKKITASSKSHMRSELERKMYIHKLFSLAENDDVEGSIEFDMELEDLEDMGFPVVDINKLEIGESWKDETFTVTRIQLPSRRRV